MARDDVGGIRRVRDFDAWRDLARQLLDDEIGPEEAAFCDAAPRQQQLAFGDDDSQPPRRELLGLPRHVVPKTFLPLARVVACHQDPTRWSLLYRLLWRLTHGELRLLESEGDDDVIRARRMAKEVERDATKMKAAVRFRQVEQRGEPRFVAWHRPEHSILQLVAPFFAERFAAMHWTIFTPREGVSWDGCELRFHAGLDQADHPAADRLGRSRYSLPARTR